MKIDFRPLHLNDEAVFYSSLKLWEGESLHWYSLIYAKDPKIPFKKLIEISNDLQEGKDLANGMVPATTLYAFYENQIVGRFNIRHKLNDYLLKRGGHVGYAVAKDFRNKGLATQMMTKALPYIQNELHLGRLLITCTDSNIASYKLIERFGGRLENKVWDEEHKEDIRRYWLTLKQN